MTIKIYIFFNFKFFKFYRSIITVILLYFLKQYKKNIVLIHSSLILFIILLYIKLMIFDFSIKSWNYNFYSILFNFKINFYYSKINFSLINVLSFNANLTNIDLYYISNSNLNFLNVFKKCIFFIQFFLIMV